MEEVTTFDTHFLACELLSSSRGWSEITARKWVSKVVTSSKIINLKVSFSVVTCLL